MQPDFGSNTHKAAVNKLHGKGKRAKSKHKPQGQQKGGYTI